MVCPINSAIEAVGYEEALLAANTPIKWDRAPARDIRVESDKASEQLLASLTDLSRRSGIPFTIINDPELPWKGKYINDANQSVVINVAYATYDTPFHEYFHPIVRLVKLKNPALYKALADKVTGTSEAEIEENIVEYLGKKAASPSLLRKFINYVKQLLKTYFNVTYDLESISTIGDFLYFLTGDLSVAKSENTLSEAYQITDTLKKLVEQKRASKTKVDYVTELLKLSESQKVSPEDNSMYYVDSSGNRVAIRATSLVGDPAAQGFSPKDPTVKPAHEARAQAVFKSQGKNVSSEEVLLDGKTFTYTELEEYFRVQESNAIIYGNMIHAYIEYKVNGSKDALSKAELNASKLGKNTLTKHPDIVTLEDKWEDILSSLDVNIKTDKMIAELPLLSKAFKTKDDKLVATTVDLIVQHADGTISIVDWKTGNLLKDDSFGVLIKYGEKHMILNNKANRAKLEVALRAFLIKEHFPDIEFKNLVIVKTKRDFGIQKLDVELSKFLDVIAEYIKDTNPELYEEYKAKGFFDIDSYLGASGAMSTLFNDAYSAMPREEKINYLRQTINRIKNTYDEVTIRDNPHIKQELDLATRALLELGAENPIRESEGTDINTLGGHLKGFSDIDHPYLIEFNKYLLEAKHKVRSEVEAIMKQHDELLTQLLAEQTNKPVEYIRKLLRLTTVAGILTLNPFLFFGSIVASKILKRLQKTTTDVFGFMWVESTDPSSPGLFANTSDYHNGKPLTAAQKAYRDFVLRTMRETYNSVMSEVLYVKTDPVLQTVETVTRASLHNKPLVLPENFLPRIPIGIEELRENEVFWSGFLGLKTRAKHFVLNNLTSHLEKEYESHTNGSLVPLKYFGQAGDYMVVSQAHSLDVSKAFALFINNLIYKKHIDHIYGIAEGLKTVLESVKTPDGKQKYVNLITWLDRQISIQITGVPKKEELHSKPIVFPPKILKLLGINSKAALVVDQSKVVHLMRMGVANMVMGLKFISSIRNGVLITLLNAMQATKALTGKALGAITGVQPDEREYSLSALGRATAHLLGFYKDLVLGKKDQNKLWLMAREFDYMPDNYSMDPVFKGYSNINAGKSDSLMFMFHNIVESYGALYHLAIIAESTKIADAKGEKKSIWDSYSVEDGKLVWNRGLRGYKKRGGQFEELRELDFAEIKALRRTFEILHGSYKQDELAAVETTVVGGLFFQFKRYFFRYMKNLFASPYYDVFNGSYVVSKDISRPDNIPVWEWEGRVSEGRLRVLAGALMAGATGKKILREYMSEEVRGKKTARVRNLTDLLNTFIWLIGLSAAYMVAFADDDEDDKVRQYALRTIRDAAQGLHPYDTFDVLKVPIVAFDRLNALGMASWTFFSEGILMGKTTREGWPKGLKTTLRNIPGISGSLQFADFINPDDLNFLR